MKHSTGWSPEDGDDTQLNEVSGSPEGQPFSAAELVQLLVVQTRDYAATEVERQRLRVRLLGAAGRDAAILVIVALFLLSGALVALMIGCIMALTPLIGAFLSTLVVVGVALALIAILLAIAVARVRAAVRVAFARAEQP